MKFNPQKVFQSIILQILKPKVMASYQENLERARRQQNM